MQQQSPLEDYRFIYRHPGVDRHRCALRHGARARAWHVRDGNEGNTGEWWAVKIIHAQKLRPSDNNNENDCSAGGSGLNGHRGPTPRNNRERERETNML